MKDKFLVLGGVVLVVLGYSSICYAPPPAAPEVKPREGVKEELREPARVPDNPEIREFSVDPTTVTPNNRITMRWRVEPTVSRIAEVNISSPALGINVRSSEATGDYAYTIPARVGTGRYQIILTATNEARRSATPRAVEINVARELGLRIIRMWTNPLEFSDGQRVEFHVCSNRNDGEDLSDVMVFIFYGGREISRIGPCRIVRGGILTTIARSVPTAVARPGRYTVELRSGGQVSRSEFRTKTVPRYIFPVPPGTSLVD